MTEFDNFTEKFESLKASGWYDPYTREEVYVCKALKYFGSKCRNDELVNRIVDEALITNNVFLTLRSVETPDNNNNSNMVERLSYRLSKSRLDELLALTPKSLSI